MEDHSFDSSVGEDMPEALGRMSLRHIGLIDPGEGDRMDFEEVAGVPVEEILGRACG